MSLSWLKKKHLRIGLGAEAHPGVGRAKAVELQSGDDWRGALGALPEILKAHSGSEASVVLADQFVRYALLPCNDGGEEPRAVARARAPSLRRAARRGRGGVGSEGHRRPRRWARASPARWTASWSSAARQRFVTAGVDLVVGAAVPGGGVQPHPQDGRQRLVLDRGRGAGPPHARAAAARRVGGDPQPPRRRALARGAARDPRARERLPRRSTSRARASSSARRASSTPRCTTPGARRR